MITVTGSGGADALCTTAADIRLDRAAPGRLAARLAVAEVLTAPAFTDLHVYRAEGAALREGLDLYGPLPGVHGLTTYPPFGAGVLPTTLLPLGVLELLALVVNLALVVVVSWQSVRRVRTGRSDAFAATCVLVAVVVWAEPVTASINYGQVNLALLALVLWDFNLPDDSRLRGVVWASPPG